MPDHVATARRRRLFALLTAAREAGAELLLPEELDAAVHRGDPCWLVKHDVHRLDRVAVLDLARAERDEGVRATWLFMVRGDPMGGSVTRPKDLADTMAAVRELGHEVGLHLDAYHWMTRTGRRLRDLLADELAWLADRDVVVRVGTTHGNARHRHPDLDGYGTAFDLFDELARQPDHPRLANVGEATARIIRTERLALRPLGFTHWLDMPVWSAQHDAFLVPSFVSDNRLGKSGTVEVLTHPEAGADWLLSTHQPPGSRRLAPEPRRIATGGPPPGRVGTHDIPVDDSALDEAVRALSAVPTLALFHPQFYV